MKRRPTKAEYILMTALDKAGIYYKFQGYFLSAEKLYIPDFRLACQEYKLIVEVDGQSHANQVEYDTRRTEWLIKNRNCRVIRFKNELIVRDVESVIKEIQIHEPLSQSRRDMDKIQNMAWYRT